jgi:hypothetical protein
MVELQLLSPLVVLAVRVDLSVLVPMRKNKAVLELG